MQVTLQIKIHGYAYEHKKTPAKRQELKYIAKKSPNFKKMVQSPEKHIVTFPFRLHYKYQ